MRAILWEGPQGPDFIRAIDRRLAGGRESLAPASSCIRPVPQSQLRSPPKRPVFCPPAWRTPGT